MNHMPQLNRRTFVVSAAAAGGGLALEHFPSALNRRDSQPLSPRRIWGN